MFLELFANLSMILKKSNTTEEKSVFFLKLNYTPNKDKFCMDVLAYK